jgi:hypothetical protein
MKMRYVFSYILLAMLAGCFLVSKEQCIRIELTNGSFKKIYLDSCGDTVRIENYNKEELLHGKYKEYQEGYLIEEGDYHDGQRIGWRIVYWPNGSYRMLAQYVHETATGESIVNQVIKLDSLGVLNVNQSEFLKIGLLDKINQDSLRIRVQYYRKPAQEYKTELLVSRDSLMSYKLDFNDGKRDLVIINKNQADSLIVFFTVIDRVYYEDVDSTKKTILRFSSQFHKFPSFEKIFPKTEFVPIEDCDTLVLYPHAERSN